MRRIRRSVPIWGTLLLVAISITARVGEILGSLPGWLEALLEGASSSTAVFLGIFIEAVPFLLIGTVASGLVEVFISREDLARWLPRSPFSGVLAGSLIGIFFPVGECGGVPFIRRLMHKGMPVPVGIAALLAIPVVNPVVFASTYAAFGSGTILWGRMGFSLVIALLTGLIFSLHSDPHSLLRENTPDVYSGNVSLNLPVAGELVASEAATAPKFADRLQQALVIAADEFFELGRYLILGALLAAFVQMLVPQSVLLGVGQGPVLSVLGLLLFAVLLSIGSSVDAFTALAFSGSFTAGSILAFLVFGSMIDIKSVLMFTRVFKPKAVMYLVLLPLMLTLVATVFINYFLP